MFTNEDVKEAGEILTSGYLAGVEEPYLPNFSMSTGELTFSFKLTKKLTKKILCRIFGMEKYQMTEWMNPRKKKRGTKRRRRREKNVFV